MSLVTQVQADFSLTIVAENKSWVKHFTILKIPPSHMLLDNPFMGRRKHTKI